MTYDGPFIHGDSSICFDFLQNLIKLSESVLRNAESLLSRLKTYFWDDIPNTITKSSIIKCSEYESLIAEILMRHYWVHSIALKMIKACQTCVNSQLFGIFSKQTWLKELLSWYFIVKKHKMWSFFIKFGELRYKNVNNTVMKNGTSLKNTLSRTHTLGKPWTQSQLVYFWCPFEWYQYVLAVHLWI